MNKNINYTITVKRYLSNFLNLEGDNTLFIGNEEKGNPHVNRKGNYKSVINLELVNNQRFINKHFELINKIINNEGIFITACKTNELRNERILSKHSLVFAYIKIYFNFFFHRVMPKLSLTKKIYFSITKGKGRALSKAEVLGRLISCGFEIVDFKEIEGLLYVISKKVKEPTFDMTPSYSPLFKMKRIGRYGKVILVYKFRTMHSYSEYLQEYLVKTHGYNNKGKIIDDFRMTKYGRFLRKYWLDELPQLLNVVKGELKLFGVRPLSQTRFNEFPDDIKEKRIKYKPGCFPPYVALLMPDKLGNIEAERIYLNEIENSKYPFFIESKYILKSLYNIIFGKIRSA